MKHFLIIALFLFYGCSSKTTSYITRLHVFGQDKQNNSVQKRNYILQKIATQLQKDTDASLYKDDKHSQNSKSDINLYLKEKYLKIYFQNILFFQPQSTILTQEARAYLEEIAVVLQKYPHIIVQLIGHAYKEAKPKKMQHISDYRAISAAEILYSSGLKQEILAKGCADHIPISICDNNNSNKTCEASNRRVDIFIYSSKEDVITKCR